MLTFFDQMSVFVSLIHNQSLTQCFQSVILSVTLIPHPVQQSNHLLKKMNANKMMDTMLEMMMAADYTLLVLEKITLTLVKECDYNSMIIM